MIETLSLIKQALIEKRLLSDKELMVIIENCLKNYDICDEVSRIDLDYNNEFHEIAGFNPLNNSLYFNLDFINRIIIEQYYSKPTVFSFYEYYLLQQLTTILHEIRHVMQLTSSYFEADVRAKIIIDSDITRYDFRIYDQYHDLFPVEKDATVFSCDEALSIIKACNYFNEEIMRVMYSSYFYHLINGYDFSKTKTGLLKDFYEQVVGDYHRYLEYQELSQSLNLHDKMSFNFSLNEEDLKKLILVPGLISKDFDPAIVLKKEIKRK